MARILVVDDEPELVQSLSMRLRSLGYEVINAFNGREAVYAAINELPDLIILDINMPGFTGHEVATELQSSMKTFTIPIIFLTARNTQVDYDDAFREGAVKYITKPFDPQELMKTVQVTLECCGPRPRE
ncbi:MAG: response regulator [bacterium]